ncbi:MAG: DoxX family protein [Haloplanus sp.]
MAYDTTHPVAGEFAFGRTGTLTAYWIALLRVVVGWWFLHAGVTKLIESGLNYTYGPAYLREMGDTVLGPVAVQLGTVFPEFIAAIVPLAETLIGLALIAGLLVRLAAAGGAVFMAFFWVGNAEFGHGVVNGDLMGLLLFVTLMVLAAGRYYGLDALVERTALVENYPWLTYLLG